MLEQPIELLLLGGFLPNGDSLSVSHIPILSVGKRYVLLLRNTYWRLSPILFNFYFRKEIVNAKPVLIDREGYAVSNLFSGRLRQRLYEAENSGEPPAQIAGDPGNLEQALAADQFVDDLIAFSQSCHESVLVGAFAPYPIVPWDVIRGSPPEPGLTSP